MRRFLPVLVAFSLLAAACGDDDQAGDSSPGSTSSTTSTTAPVTTEPAAPDTTTTVAAKPDIPLLGRGEYTVGVSTITITDATRDRPLTVEVWYPVADDTAGDPHRYTFVTGDYYESPLAVSADPATDAAAGPFPLLVYSHGNGGVRFIHSDYTETVASHGYVVAAPDHTGNTAVERILDTYDDAAVVAVNRPLDVGVVIDAFVGPGESEATPFQAVLDPEKIAVTGHSFGGFTAYAAAAGFESDQGTVEADPRIDALIPLAPAVGDADGRLSDEVLARIEIPALVIVGTDDKTTPVDPNVDRAWERTASDPHFRLELVAGEHQSFTDLCQYLDAFADREAPTPIVVETVQTMAVEGCSADDMPIGRVQELTNTFAVTFLDSVFGDIEMFTPDAFNLPEDIKYLVKG